VRLRKAATKGLGRKYSEKFFQDTILCAGSLPMKYMQEIFDYKVKELGSLAKSGF